MVSCELPYWISDSEIPQLDGVISTAGQESIKGVTVAEAALVEFDCVRVPLVPIVHCSDRLIRTRVVDHQLFI